MKFIIDTKNMTKEELITLQQELSKIALLTWEKNQNRTRIINTENMTSEELLELHKELSRVANDIWEKDQKLKHTVENLTKMFDGVSIDNGIVFKK